MNAYTADAADWICPVCLRPQYQGAEIGHLYYHIHELHDKLYLQEKALEGQVGELVRAVKENLRRAVEAEGEALDLRERLTELGE